ncbi:unnamed protein product, partial [Effrenium voratum]
GGGAMSCLWSSGTREFFHVSPLYWTETELSRWLEWRGLPSCIGRAFEDHLVNGLVALDLTAEDLCSMGIFNDLHRRRVLLELRQLYGSEDWETALKTIQLAMLRQTEARPAFEPEPKPESEPEGVKPSPYLARRRRPKAKQAPPEEPTTVLTSQQKRAAAASLHGLDGMQLEAALVSALPGALEKMLSGRPVRSAPRARDGQPVPRVPKPRDPRERTDRPSLGSG